MPNDALLHDATTILLIDSPSRDVGIVEDAGLQYRDAPIVDAARS